MAEPRLRDVLHELRRAALADAAGVSDRDLLDRFIANRDEAAFELLVWRHQRLVLGVCRRVLQHTQDAEDAFQATFLTLARKAASIRGHAVAAWLYKVAYHIAIRLRVQQSRRSEVEAKKSGRTIMSTSQVVDQWADVRPILDEELGRLPDRYRVPIVLCYLEGKTYDEAARDLRLPKGTVSIRLTRARELLRDRLTRRGVTLSAAAVATVLTEQTCEASVPTALVEAAFVTSLRNAATPAVQALSHFAGRALVLQTTRTVAALAASILVLAAGLGIIAHAALANMNDPPVPPAIAQKQDGRKDEPKLEPGFDAFGDALPTGAAARLGTLRWRHGGWSTLGGGLNFTPDGKSLISSGWGWIRRWDVATGRELVTLGDGWRSGWGGSEFVTPDGKLGRFCMTVRLPIPPGSSNECTEYSLEDGKLRRTYTLVRDQDDVSIPSHFEPSAYSPDGKVLATINRSRGGITLWNIAGGSVLHYLPPQDGNFTVVAFVSDGKTLLAGNESHNIRTYDVTTGKEQRSFGVLNGNSIATLAVSPDGKWLVSAARKKRDADGVLAPLEGFFRLWDLKDGTVVRTIDFPEPWRIGFTLFTADGKTLVAGMGFSGVRSWDIPSGQLGRIWTADPDAGPVIAASSDGKTLAAMSLTGVIRLWDMASGAERTFAASTAALEAVCFRPDSRTVLTVGRDGYLRLWDATSGKLMDVPPITAPGAFHKFAAGGKLLLVEVARGPGIPTLRVCDAVNGKPLWERKGNSPITNSDGTLIAAIGPDRGIYVCETATGKEIQHIAPSLEGINSDSVFPRPRGFTTDGKSLLVVSKAVSLWDLQTGNQGSSWSILEKKVLEQEAGSDRNSEQLKAVEASADASKVAFVVVRGRSHEVGRGAWSSRITVFDTRTGNLLHQAEVDDDACKVLAFSPDGKRLAVSGNWTVRVWDLQTHKEIHFSERHRGSIRSLAFSPDGTRLASASEDSTVLIWNVGK